MSLKEWRILRIQCDVRESYATKSLQSFVEGDVMEGGSSCSFPARVSASNIEQIISKVRVMRWQTRQCGKTVSKVYVAVSG